MICGEGAMLENLKQFASQLTLDNLSFIHFQNREGVKEIMNVTDAAFICYRPVKILETGSPNKYFDALAAGKLCIINFGGWIRDEVEGEKCGVFLDANQPTEFVKKIAPFLEDRTMLISCQQAARALAERKYSRKILAARFAEIITDRYSNEI
jgi:glycosyltransferase involved in cell wall biosynthesis